LTQERILDMEKETDKASVINGLDFPCKRCKGKIEEPGAIMISPPDKDDFCKKYHICSECFPEVLRFIRGENNGNSRNVKRNKKR